ncbi:MAG: magnesium transporter [Bacteroidota bacterium]
MALHKGFVVPLRSLMQEAAAILERVETLFELDATTELQEYLNDLSISDVADLVKNRHVPTSKVYNLLEFHRAVAVFRVLDFSEQEELLQELHPEMVAQLINELAPDDRTALLAELPSSAVKQLIKLLEPEERKVTLSLLGYPESSVGRLMTPDYIDVEPDWSVKQVLDFIRMNGKHVETIDVIYVTDVNGVLLDDIRIRDFLIAEATTKVAELMDNRCIALKVMDDQKETVQEFQNNNRVALPVVDDKNIMLGIVTIDDVLWVAEEEYTEDIQMIGGTEALDEPYLEVTLRDLYKKRVVWLIILFIGELLTISAMTRFQDQIAKVVALATFIPLIISSGGNSGSQAATLIIQAMALGEVTLKDWWRVMRREIISGLLLGCTLSLLSVIVLLLWHAIAPATLGDLYIQIALVVSTSLIGVVLWGTLMGSMLPIFLKRMGADPAASSTPFVATLVDVTGLLIYFGSALIFLNKVIQ